MLEIRQLEHSSRPPFEGTAVCHWALRASRKRRLLARVRELEAGEQRLQALEAGLAAAAEAEAATASAAAQAAAAAASAAKRDAAGAAASGAADKPPGCEVAVRGERPCGSGSEAGSAPTALGADALYNPDWVRRAQIVAMARSTWEKMWLILWSEFPRQEADEAGTGKHVQCRTFSTGKDINMS